MKIIDQLLHRSAELMNLNNIMALLQWDQEVMMPSGATAERANQFSILSTIIHQKITDPELGNLLKEAADSAEKLSQKVNAIVRILSREHFRNIKLPEKFVAEFTRHTAESLPAWVTARKQNDFKIFQPYLEKIVSMSRQKADYLGYKEHPYDSLLDLYEEGLTSAQLDDIFADLQPELTVLVQQKAITSREKLADFSFPPILEKDQIAFSERLLKEIGYDFNRGRQDISPHPFTTSLGHNDRRVTNRFRPDSLEFIFSALHEGGHALYEQGIAQEYSTTSIDEGVSLGIHESQSRLWENIIGRSRPFWSFYFSLLQQYIPYSFQNINLDEFVRYINRVQPGLIRVEADEISYNLHIIVRFELEKELLAGNIQVAELPSLWQEKYNAYLNLDVNSEANGVLQDIHWAHSSFGYFPTYTIGNLAAAQIWHSYCCYDTDHEKNLFQGNLQKIRQWLTDNIYRHGALFSPAELLHRVCGEPLASGYFIDYLRNKKEFSL